VDGKCIGVVLLLGAVAVCTEGCACDEDGSILPAQPFVMDSGRGADELEIATVSHQSDTEGSAADLWGVGSGSHTATIRALGILPMHEVIALQARDIHCRAGRRPTSLLS
jgi:hypothetical protein